MKLANTIRSLKDPSVNFIFNYQKGNVEARYVRKTKEYISAYVSSHSGCRLKCKMCFLTHNQSTSFDHVTLDSYREQLQMVLDEHQRAREYLPEHLPDNILLPKVDISEVLPKVNLSEVLQQKRCNVNFMARGDVMANRHIINSWPAIYNMMDELCGKYQLKFKPNLSTIMPHTVRDRSLASIFGDRSKSTYMYYSLYSTDPAFRKEWLPNALPFRESLDKLKEFQISGGPIVTFHWSLIKGHNDGLEDTMKMVDVLKEYQFNAKVNIVRYNNHPSLPCEEADQSRIDEIFKLVDDGLNNNDKSYIVPRIGTDAFVSCGMFPNDLEVGPNDLEVGPSDLELASDM
jgi:23S rRNA (adenine2503-C2)-methyltransferase